MKQSRTVLFILVSVLPLTAFIVTYQPLSPRQSGSPAKPVPTIDYTGFDRLLKKYVDNRGLVNYKAFRSDSTALDAYLALLE